MTQPEQPTGIVTEKSIEQQLAALEHLVDYEHLQLSLVPGALDALRAELATIERTLDRNYTYLFPLTRRRLKAQAGDLHRRIALQAIELEDVQERHFHPVAGKH